MERVVEVEEEEEEEEEEEVEGGGGDRKTQLEEADAEAMDQATRRQGVRAVLRRLPSSAS